MTWRKSTYSSDSWNCVEVRWVDGGPGDDPRVEVRDSKDPNGAVLGFTGAYWEWLLARVATGEPVATINKDASWVRWRNAVDGWVELQFTPSEWAAFVAGVVAGEFDLDRLSERSVTT